LTKLFFRLKLIHKRLKN